MLNGVNWLYHVAMSRLLGPVGYGGLSALLGLLVVLTIPVNTVQMGLSAFVARIYGKGEGGVLRGLLYESLRGALMIGVLSLIVVTLMSYWIAGALKFESVGPVVLSATALISWASLPVLRGMLQGARRFVRLAVSLAAEGIFKFVASVIFVSLGWGLNGAVAGVSLGALAALVLTILAAPAWSPFEEGEHIPQLINVLRSLGPYAVLTSCFTLLTQLDVVFVRILFPPYEAGLYAAASTGSKVILYLTAALPMVLLPEMASRHSMKEDGRIILMRCLVYGGSLGGMTVLLYFMAPNMVTRIMFGDGYVGASSILGLLGVGMLGYELALLGMYYQLGIEKRGFLRPVGIMTLVFPILLLVFRGSIHDIAYLMATMGICALIIVSWGIFFPRQLVAKSG